MDEAIAAVVKLLNESDDWYRTHKNAGRRIEAAGVRIRMKALQDVLAALHDLGK